MKTAAYKGDDDGVALKHSMKLSSEEDYHSCTISFTKKVPWSCPNYMCFNYY